MWKRCVTGSFDFVDKNDDAIFHIYNFDKNSDKDKVSGQVFYGEKYAELIREETIELFALKAAVKASQLGWDIDIAKVNLSPDLSSVPIYESRIYKQYYDDDNYEVVLDKRGNRKFKKV
tara:strand:+ start:111 stop:467 length:357 start_codon:yes stop_codon:yes gene_type:complete